MSLRGWGATELQTARPEFLAAARFAMFAERMIDLRNKYRRIAEEPIDKSSSTLPADIKRQAAATEMVDLITEMLFPKDEVDG